MLFTMAVSLCTSRIGKNALFVIHRHTDTSEVMICIYPSAIERLYDEQGNGREMVVMKIIVFAVKAHRYNINRIKTNKICN